MESKYRIYMRRRTLRSESRGERRWRPLEGHADPVCVPVLSELHGKRSLWKSRTATEDPSDDSHGRRRR